MKVLQKSFRFNETLLKRNVLKMFMVPHCVMVAKIALIASQTKITPQMHFMTVFLCYDTKDKYYSAILSNSI